MQTYHSPVPISNEVVFDASKTFTEVRELIATEYVFDNYGNQTTGVAMMNPGWQQRNKCCHKCYLKTSTKIVKNL